MITKTDGSLRKADVRYLEARLVELAKQSPLAVVENGKNPAPPCRPRPTRSTSTRSSPTSAGAVLYGGQVNGRKHGKDVNGKTLAEREAAAVDDVQ